MIAEDRARVCDLLRKGYKSRTEMCLIINEGRDPQFHISPAQVGKDISYMKDKYLEQGFDDLKVVRNTIIDQLDLLKRTYWHGYELSRRSKITLESEGITNDEEYQNLRERGLELQTDENIFDRQTRVREESRAEGNPAFLQGVLSCIDRQARIYGIDAPSKVSLTDPSGTKEASSAFELMKRKMDELAERHKQGVEQEFIEQEAVEVKLLDE
jgi:hypothetical protein